MRLTRRSLLAGLSLSSSGLVRRAVALDRVKAVASFSILADLVRNVGGESLDVTTLVGPDSDAHVYQPAPADARAIAAARLVVLNGLGFEGWINRLIEAASFNGIRVLATKGVEPLPPSDDGRRRENRTADPHAWQDVRHGMIYVGNITEGLSRADPGRAMQYRANAEAYLAKLRELDAWVVTELSAIPPEKRQVITSHDAFEYFGRRYGVTFRAPLGLSTDSEASAKDVAALIRQIRSHNIRAVFIENMSDPRLLRQLTSETGAAIGGTLYADALSAPDGPAPSYIDMFRHNVTELAAAMRKN